MLEERVESQLAFLNKIEWLSYANLRAGVLGEALCLPGTALGVGTCGVGAFPDSDPADILGLRPDDESSLYVTAIGR